MPAASGPEPSQPDPLLDDHALWDLLARAPRPPSVPGAFFAHRVMRGVACFEAERVAQPSWRRRWQALSTVVRPPRRVILGWPGASFAGITAVVLTLGTFGFRSGGLPPALRRLLPAQPPSAGEMMPERDAEVVAHLDELTAEPNENVVWLDEDDDGAS